ncbi:triacylglycerol lipase, partial [Oesophagostomum dentatum]
MADAFTSLKTKYPDYEVWVTGHSLGGSLASLAASFIVGHGYASSNTTKLVTFGQPRTGDDTYAGAYGAQVFYRENMTSDEFAVCE